jgi:hypothetical protein
MKLFKVTCKGMTYSTSNVVHGIAYVVAANADEAYQMLRERLDKAKLGYDKDRVLDRVELIAETGTYPECGTALLLKDKLP